ncbi:hypothetical protein BS78_K051700 [Paspalum vaginatum]|uniref:Exocyst subunit Exo70 family protein n=1 Tax=Paspalum vaginatum TaxID=158149 RepID=A0A9W7X757_9POAL|nr:hypothetical protein BS78_K051700 [Paspalum vaginatum]
MAVAALPQTMDALSQGNTDGMVAILGSFDHRLSALEAAMRPPRTHAIRTAHENIDRTIKAADGILSQFDLARRAEAAILRGPHEDLESYLEAVEVLKGISSEGVLNHVNNLLAKSTLKIEEEFKQLMSTYSKPIEPDRLFDCLPKSLRPTKGDHEADGGSHSDHPSKGLETAIYRTPTLIPPRILPLMNDIAQQLVQAGNQQSCYKIYRDSRASALEMSLRKLGVEKLSKDDVKLLLAGERKICDQIFDGVNFNTGHCFAELTANSVITLFSFGDAVAKSKRSPEKLFVLLDMYEVMRELQPEIEEVFEGKPCIEMREAASSLTKRLAQTAQETFADFEDAVEKDASKTIVQDGTVHPLTSYVINYVKFLFEKAQCIGCNTYTKLFIASFDLAFFTKLGHLLGCTMSLLSVDMKLLFQEFDSGTEAESQLASVTTRIMQALQNNLDGKSKQYKDPALTYLFLMNNIHYMVRSVRRSEAKDILGDDWIQRHRRIVQQNANQYKRVAWAKILQTLSVQGAGSTGDLSSSGVSRAMIKERLSTCTSEELHAKQSQWIVPDQELRESLRLAVAEVLCQPYRSFIKRFGTTRNPQKYVRYSPEAVDQLLGQFSKGSNGRSRSAEQQRHTTRNTT